MTEAPRYVLIANPGGPRVVHYERDLRAFWREQGTEPEVVIAPWRDVIRAEGELDALPGFHPPPDGRPTVVRLESPGRDVVVERMLAAVGRGEEFADRGFESLPEPPRGLIFEPPRDVFLGLYAVFGVLQSALDERKHLTCPSRPRDLAATFEKTETSRRLNAAGVRVPDYFAPERRSTLVSALAIAPRCSSLGFQTAYVKLACGSSACGIAVLNLRGRGPVVLSTLLNRDGEFYNSRRLNDPDNDEFIEIMNFILAQEAIVQRGVPKAEIDGLNFDVRVVVIYGKPAFTVFRLSPHRITNLHLGGVRGRPEDCRPRIPTRRWLDGLDACVHAAGLFDAAAVGVDLLFERGSFKPYVLEVNAFGDFVPGWTDNRGRTIHRVEIEETARRMRAQ